MLQLGLKTLFEPGKMEYKDLSCKELVVIGNKMDEYDQICKTTVGRNTLRGLYEKIYNGYPNRVEMTEFLKELLIRYNLFALQCNGFERALGQLMREANIASPVASMDAAVMMNQGFR